MLELIGYLVCGAIIGTTCVASGRMRAHQALITVGVGLIALLACSLAPHLGAPQDEVRAALAGQGLIALWFFLALLSALAYVCLQILDDVTPDRLVPVIRRLENASVATGGLMVILALATVKLTLAA